MASVESNRQRCPGYVDNRWRHARDGDRTGHICQCGEELFVARGRGYLLARCYVCERTRHLIELSVDEDEITRKHEGGRAGK